MEALAEALSKAQAEFTAVAKTETNPFFKSKYAGLPQVVAAASPILAKHGLCVSQTVGWDTSGDESFDTLTTMLLHTSGQVIQNTMRLHLDAKLNGAQAQGSAITYARRYSYMAILGLVADEDDDGNATSPKAPAPALGAMTKRRAPTSATSSESPPEARLSAADAKRELIDHAVSLGWDPTDAKTRAKEAWGDGGTGGLLRGQLELMKMSIEKAPGQ